MGLSELLNPISYTLFCPIKINYLVGKIKSELFACNAFNVGIVDWRMKTIIELVNSVLKLLLFESEL